MIFDHRGRSRRVGAKVHGRKWQPASRRAGQQIERDRDKTTPLLRRQLPQLLLRGVILDDSPALDSRRAAGQLLGAEQRQESRGAAGSGSKASGQLRRRIALLGEDRWAAATRDQKLLGTPRLEEGARGPSRGDHVLLRTGATRTAYPPPVRGARYFFVAGLLAAG